MLALSTGWNRRTLSDIELGVSHKGDGMAEVVSTAKNLIAAAEGQLALTGDINSTVYMFRAKNYHGMVDRQEVSVVPQYTQMEIPLNAEEIINNVPELDEGE